jgi:hypothetical protein
MPAANLRAKQLQRDIDTKAGTVEDCGIYFGFFAYFKSLLPLITNPGLIMERHPRMEVI